MMSSFTRRFKRFSVNWMALAFLLLACVGGFALSRSNADSDNKLYTSQIQGCERANDLRRESNRRIEAHEADRDTLIQFLEAARAARRSAASRDHLPSDIKAVHDYTKLILHLELRVKFLPVSLINCAKVIHRP